VFGDTTAALRAFEAGEIDETHIQSADWDRLEKTGKYKIFRDLTNTVIYVIMNNTVEPFDDMRVRQAFNYAVDREEMLFAAVDGYGTTISTIGKPDLVFAVPKPGEIFEYSYDPEEAKELLAEAGYPDGLTLDSPIYTLASEEFTIPAQVLQQQLGDIGVTVEIQEMEQGAYVQDLFAGNFQIGVMGIALVVDASMVAMVYDSAQIGGGYNFAGYANEEVDALFAQAASTLDQDARKQYFHDAFDIASREAAYLPLYTYDAIIASDPDLTSSVRETYYYWSWA